MGMGTREEDEGGGLYTIQVRVTGPEMATGVRTEGRFFSVFFFFFHGWERNINSSLSTNILGSP